MKQKKDKRDLKYGIRHSTMTSTPYKYPKGYGKNTQKFVNVNHDFINPLTSNDPRAIELVEQMRKILSEG